MWKEQLYKLEQTKEWDAAIELLQKILKEDPDSLDAYLSMNYLLMNLLVEEEHPAGFKHQLYERLLKHSFDEPYSKFSDNAEYLFYIGTIAIMSEWYFDIDIDVAEKFLAMALSLEPSNMLYQYGYHSSLKGAQNQLAAYECAKKLLETPVLKQQIEAKGSLGEYILMLMNGWSKHIEDELAGIRPKFYLKDR